MCRDRRSAARAYFFKKSAQSILLCAVGGGAVSAAVSVFFFFRCFAVWGCGVNQISGSSFEWGDIYDYDDELFREWVSGMEYYLENSYLVLSTQDGEIRTERISEREKYCYETLSLKNRMR